MNAITISQAIKRFDLLYANLFSYKAKLGCISVLDEMFFKNAILKYLEQAEVTFNGYTTDTDPSTELLIPFPFDDIYIKYLAMQKSLVDEDYESWMVSSKAFVEEYEGLIAFYERKHKNTSV